MKLAIISVALLTCCFLGAGEPVVVAHRGASKEAPENTIPAFLLAWKQGADAIEGDFHLTKDGHIVCIHDSNTQRTAGVALEVKESTLEELKKLDVGSSHHRKYKGIKIPTLQEVLATVPSGKKIFIEIKSGPSIVPVLLRELENSNLIEDQIVVISFGDEVIKLLESRAPQFKSCLLVSLQTDNFGNLTPSIFSIYDRLQICRADGLSASYGQLSRELISAVQGEGFECHAWTVDDPIRGVRLKEWGIQSITTNVPGYLRRHLVR